MSDLDPKLTFESFVVGPANRLASAAAKRAADSPGTSYNPLFMYSAPGLGKTHILTAIAHQSSKGGAEKVEYMPLEGYLERLEGSLQVGKSEALYGDLDILLLDDVQFLTGQPEAQEMLLKTLDQLTAAGGQIVLASDRPPADIDGLDARLLSRFSGGLIVDLGPPEFETRVAIIRKKAEERGQTLEEGVAEAVAKAPFKNVRELGGVLNKIFATQDLEGRKVTQSEVMKLLQEQDQVASLGGGSDEFGSFLDELASSVAQAVEKKEEPWRKAIREAIESADRQGYAVHRLEAHQGGGQPKNWQQLVETFNGDIQRLRDIDKELERLGNPWPEAAQGRPHGSRIGSRRRKRSWRRFASGRDRSRELGGGPLLHDLDGFDAMALKAAAQLVGEEKPEYNPLFIWSAGGGSGAHPTRGGGAHLQGDVPRSAHGRGVHRALLRGLHPGPGRRCRRCLARAVVDRRPSPDSWSPGTLRHGACPGRVLSPLRGAQASRSARMMLVADRAPSSVESIDDRLRSRFEGGLVLEVTDGVAADLELVERASRGEPTTGSSCRTWRRTAGPQGPRHAHVEPVPAALPEPPEPRVVPGSRAPRTWSSTGRSSKSFSSRSWTSDREP